MSSCGHGAVRTIIVGLIIFGKDAIAAISIGRIAAAKNLCDFSFDVPLTLRQTKNVLIAAATAVLVWGRSKR